MTKTLEELLDQYQPEDKDEQHFKQRFLNLLSEPHCFERKNLWQAMGKAKK